MIDQSHRNNAQNQNRPQNKKMGDYVDYEEIDSKRHE